MQELTTAEQQQMVTEKLCSRKAFRVGLARPLPYQLENLDNSTAQLTSQSTLYLLRVITPEAKAVRLHFKTLQLPAHAQSLWS
ncbi:MAG: hypothetical protein JNM09_19790 [Blastocatellia bacterium]|nr:hypothetical protein [Blastocatellia bacterium]